MMSGSLSEYMTTYEASVGAPMPVFGFVKTVADRSPAPD
jgi:hypothetical protein